MSKKLGDIVRPIFDKIGATVEHRPGIVIYTTTMKQLDRYFKDDPFGKAFMAAYKRAPGIPLSQMMEEIKKRKVKKRKRRK